MGPLLVLAFLAIPFAEIWVLLRVGREIGLLPTIGLLIVVSVVGASLAKREGARAWRSLVTAMTQGRLPTKEALDGACVLLAGALLVTPGFLTDVLGLALLFPPTRLVLRGVLLRGVLRRVVVVGGDGPGPLGPRGPHRSRRLHPVSEDDPSGVLRDRGTRDGRRDDVIDGEVVDER